MKKILIGTASFLVAATTAMPAYSQDVSVSTSIDYVTDYVFRGVSLADSAIQPGVEVAVGDFTVGAWFSTGVGDTSILAGDEVDLYASYSFALSETISTDVGITYYHYPQGGSLFETEGGGAGTYEVFASLGFDTMLAPSASVYYDLTLEAFTLEGGIGHSFPAGDKTSFDLGATVGLVDGDGFSYEYGSASASLGYAFTDAVSAYVGANYALSSEDTLNYKKILQGTPKDNLLFFGAGIAAGF
ncbi:MAG: TorF family putative porin [Hellea sp.]